MVFSGKLSLALCLPVWLVPDQCSRESEFWGQASVDANKELYNCHPRNEPKTDRHKMADAKIALGGRRPLAPHCNLSEYARSSDVSLVLLDILSLQGLERIHEQRS